MAKTKTDALTVSMQPYDGKDDGLSILASVQVIEITSKETAETLLSDVKRWKQENREIEFYYNNPKDGIVALLRGAYERARDMRDDHLRPRKEAITAGEKLVTGWNRERQRIEDAEADRIRREAEAAEQARRDEAAAKAEAEALALEASSEALSEREQKFVALFISNRDRNVAWPETNAARAAGYKEFKVYAVKLMASAKIQQAIANADKAAAIRRQSEAAQAAPVIVDVAPVVSEIATVAGTSVRTYYGCDSQVDLKALAAAVLAGTVPVEAIQPNMVYLNAQARMLKSTFPSTYPGCKLAQRDGVTG